MVAFEFFWDYKRNGPDEQARPDAYNHYREREVLAA